MTSDDPPPLDTRALKTITNAVENASNEPITPAAILAILRSGRGHPSHVRAIFGDVSLRALDRAAAAAGIDPAALLGAYAIARDAHAAANPELERALTERW